MGMLRWLLCFLYGMCLLGPASLTFASSQKIQLKPSKLKIETFFDGADVAVSGEIPEGCEAVLEVTGRVAEEDLMRKGRRWDIWMNVGEIDIDGVPRLYLAMSSDPGLLSESFRPKPSGRDPDCEWGYEGLRKSVSFLERPKKIRRDTLFEEFIQLEEGRGLYGLHPGALKIRRVSGRNAIVEGKFRMPSRVSPGVYKVCLSAVKDGRVVEKTSVPLQVAMVGFPAFLCSLAAEHVVFYGFFAVAIAVMAGFVTGFLFSAKKRKPPEGEDRC